MSRPSPADRPVGEPPVDRTAIAGEMDAARARLHALLDAADAADLRRVSDGTRWTNEQLLFHMVFGYLVVRTLLPLVRVVGRLPAPVGRGWAALLNAVTRPFHVVNYWGSVGGARVFDHARMGPLADRTIAALQRSLSREPEAALHCGMPFPAGWDPYFGYLTLVEVYRYPTRHFEHHRRQLTLRTDSQPGRQHAVNRSPAGVARVQMTTRAADGWRVKGFRAMPRRADPDDEQLRRLLAETARLERLQASLLDNIVEGVLLQDASGRVITSNSAAREILGLSADELHGRALNKLRSALRSDGTPWPAEERPTAATVRARGGLRGRIVGVHVGDGLRWLSLNTDAVLAPSGDVEYVVSSIRDITQEHAAVQAEQQARRARRDRVDELLRDGGLSVVVQPIVDLATGRAVGAEALARFPACVAQAPEVWFADAVAAGLAVELELAAIERALATLDQLPPELYLSLNASPAALTSPRLVELLVEGPTERLVLELTEHVAVADYDVLAGPLNTLRAAGLRLAVDDAGAGFSSLQHILELAPDIIKLDRALVRDVQADPARASLVGCLVLFADRIGADLVAEGIETCSGRDALQDLGVRYGQGFHLGRPVPVAALAESLSSAPQLVR